MTKYTGYSKVGICMVTVSGRSRGYTALQHIYSSWSDIIDKSLLELDRGISLHL